MPTGGVTFGRQQPSIFSFPNLWAARPKVHVGKSLARACCWTHKVVIRRLLVCHSSKLVCFNSSLSVFSESQRTPQKGSAMTALALKRQHSPTLKCCICADPLFSCVFTPIKETRRNNIALLWDVDAPSVTETRVRGYLRRPNRKRKSL